MLILEKKEVGQLEGKETDKNMFWGRILAGESYHILGKDLRKTKR